MSSTSPSFIGEFQISKNLCKEIIDFYNSQPFYDPPGFDFYSKTTGMVGNKTNYGVKPEVKSSTDMGLGTNLIYSQIPSRAVPYRDILIKYLKELNPCVDEYLEKYPEAGEHSFQLEESINIQHYEPGQGFLKNHCERSGPEAPNNTRHLVFMTFLNTVNDGGGTEFKHHDIIYKAEEGKTIIWPTDWTHTHRGIISNTEHKYIMTGWYSFCREFWEPRPLEEDQLILDLGLSAPRVEIMA
jgi:hypothetical protein